MADPLAEDDQPDNSGGSMLALYPPDGIADLLALPDGLPAGEIHLTVAYTGKAGGVDPVALKTVARVLARRDPLPATISGTARFTGGDTDVAVALADSPDLEDLRRDAMGLLASYGITVPRDHGYTAHLTRAYIPADDPDPSGRLAAVPVTFTTVSAVHGGDRTDYPFAADPGDSPLAEAARQAFAAGYKRTGAPVTPRARAAFDAAVATACMYPDDPDVIPDTVRLGHLEGLHALAGQRRSDLAAAHVEAITEAWNRCVHSLNGRRLVSRYRAGIGLAGDNGHPGDPGPGELAAWRTVAAGEADEFIRGIRETTGYPALAAAAADAIRAGLAEGQATARGLAAAHRGRPAPGTAGLYTAAYSRLRGDPRPGDLGAATLDRITAAAAADLADRLESMTAAGESYTGMLTGCWATAGASQVRAVAVHGTQAVLDAVTAGTARCPGGRDVSEVTLHLGKLQGTWADVYRRRDELTAAHAANVTAVWQRLMRRLKPKQLVKRYRQMTLIDTPVEAEGPDSWRKNEARAAALAWLYQILRDAQLGDLEDAIIAAIIAAAAEGKTAALAVAADKAGQAINWQKTYAAMSAGLAGLEEIPGMADPWVQQILGGAATDVARVLASLATPGSSDAQVAKAILALVGGDDFRAVTTVIDLAIGKSMAQASLDLYQSEGLTLIAWLSAGDGRVCVVCEENEENGPYDPAAFPECPSHVNCRCSPAPASPLPVSAFADFLVPV